MEHTYKYSWIIPFLPFSICFGILGFMPKKPNPNFKTNHHWFNHKETIKHRMKNGVSFDVPPSLDSETTSKSDKTRFTAFVIDRSILELDNSSRITSIR